MINNHVIGSCLWEINTRTMNEAKSVQQMISDNFWNSIKPGLAEEFDQIADEDEFITLDKVVIELGDIDLNHLDIIEIINKMVSSIRDECFKSEFIGRVIHAFEKQNKSGDIKKDADAYYFDLWIKWLEKGFLPYHAIKPNKDWIQGVLKTLAIDYRSTDRLTLTLKRNPIVLDRLTQQLDKTAIISIIEIFSGHNQKSLVGFVPDLVELKMITSKWAVQKSTSLPQNQLDALIWKSLIRLVILEAEKLPPEQLMNLIAKKINLIDPIKELINQQSSSEQPDFKVPNSIKNNKIYNLLVDSDEIDNEVNPSKVKEEENIDDTSPNLDSDLIENQDGKGYKSTQIESEHSDEALINEEYKNVQDELRNSSDAVFISEAGLCLLHPFLKTLFNKLDLTKDGEFKDFQAKTRAIHLLHYMATGESQALEYDLIFAKVLCGCPTNLPIDRHIELSEEEKAESLELLKAVIDHWGVLGQVGPDALREGFLVRNGKLMHESGAWKLYVESNTIDVLLDRLPWNMSVIKLPWMEDMLHIQWR